MTVDLSPEAARAVVDAVESGEFPNASAVIEAVVQSWQSERGELFDYTPDELDRLAEEAEASGPGRTVDFERLAREARQGFEAETSKA